MNREPEGSKGVTGRRIDLHVHSKYSDDGVLEPERLVKVARRQGLAGIAITDHNTIRGGQEAKKYETEDFEVIIGAEIMTEKGEITGLFLSREVESGNFQDVVSEIRAQGGIVVIPHPFDGMRRSSFSITTEYVGMADAVETFNSRCVLSRYNKRALEFATQNNLAVIGGSDAHHASEIGLAGIVTYSRDVRTAILWGEVEVFGKRSPLLNHVRTKTRRLWQRTTQRTQ